MATKKAYIEIIKKALENNPKAVEKALVIIFERQTADEQNADMTRVHNKIGFRPQDAAFGSSLAKRILRGYSLSPKQLECGRRMAMHYTRQLYEHAKAVGKV